MNLRYPERLLQPWKDLRQFTQELYAMCKNAKDDDTSGGVDVDTPPVTIGDQSFKVQRTTRGELSLVPEPRERRREAGTGEGPPKPESPTRRVRPQERSRRADPVIEERRERASERPKLPEVSRPKSREPRILAEPEERRREIMSGEPDEPERKRKAEDREEPKKEYKPSVHMPKLLEESTKRKPIDFLNVVTAQDYPTSIGPPGSGGGTTVFVGKVASGSGARYEVTLYENGPNGDPTPGTVTVTIPMLDPSEQIDPGTWLFGVFEFADLEGNPVYSAQPPVWM